ncbi:GNAT family N-acetyltransferase [Kribbella sp. NPDC004875]|uniref:GNAT family N-acetyltransferase n=1 Tax=Kribbella sp. NPDC004875 TaxID=3364107 RepID=UPI00369D40D3
MADLVIAAWPPEMVRTARLVVREAEARDRDGFVELLASGKVRRYLGGARPRAEIEEAVPDVPGRRTGVFAVEAENGFIGAVSVNRRDRSRPGHVRPEGEELEVSYTFLPEFWGRGYATEAVSAVLQWVAEVLPGEPVVLCTQSANERSVRLAGRLGFVEVERFTEFEAEQWFGVRDLDPTLA